MSPLLQVTAGTGPVEVRRFVAELAPALGALLAARGVAVEGAVEAPGSVGLLLGEGAEGRVADLLGTHLLVAAERGRGARKRWFAHVGLHVLPEGAPDLDPRDVDLAACRAGGPGGQHVNTACTAVRAVHRPTGLAVRAEGERSRAANRRAALRRLAALLAARGEAAAAAADQRRWRDHHRVERGRPVRTWTRDHRGRLCPAA